MKNSVQKYDYQIPGKLNILIFFGSLAISWYFLWVTSHGVWWSMILAAIGFSLFNNTLFTLLHEAVHNVFSSNPKINELFGHLCAVTFPTAFSMQKIAHLGHHRRNRTDVEMFDYYLPGESKTKRNIMLYLGNLLGVYWFTIPLMNLLIILAPNFATSDWLIRNIGKPLGFAPFLEEISEIPKLRLWLESFFAFAYQVIIWFMLDLNWQGWLIAYWFFALHWSSLQYVNHAWTPRDIINGAWNLKVHLIPRLIALNYHCHLAHHRFPDIPWIHLPKLKNENEENPTFWEIYFSLWRSGVQPAPPMTGETKI